MKYLSIMLTLLLLPCALYAQMTVVGQWKTIDDETKKAKSIVEIYQDKGTFKGKILELINPEKADPRCDKCPGDKANQPLVGLEILWGLKKSEDKYQWDDGKILDPENGKVYSCRLKLKNKGQELEVRGFIGFSLFGRSQTWYRVGANEEKALSKNKANTAAP